MFDFHLIGFLNFWWFFHSKLSLSWKIVWPCSLVLFDFRIFLHNPIVTVSCLKWGPFQENRTRQTQGTSLTFLCSTWPASSVELSAQLKYHLDVKFSPTSFSLSFSFALFFRLPAIFCLLNFLFKLMDSVCLILNSLLK